MKRKIDDTTGDGPVKQPKMETGDKCESIASRVFAIRDLCNCIISYLYDPDDEIVYEDRFISMRMLSLVSKRVNEICVASARLNCHKKIGIDVVKANVIKLGYSSCLDYLHHCDPINIYVYSIFPDVDFIRKCYFMGFYLNKKIYGAPNQEVRENVVSDTFKTMHFNQISITVSYSHEILLSVMATLVLLFFFRFSTFDGATLLEYRSMRQEAPEAFFADLAKDGISRTDRLRLSRALKDLV